MGELQKRIKEHINMLCEYWKGKPYGEYYIDAYRCIEHNLLSEDIVGIKEMTKELPELYPWEKEGFDFNTMIEYYSIETTDRERKLIKWLKKWLK